VLTAAGTYSLVRRDAMGLDLPIDHFRLLGVSPTSDAQQVLRTLAQRLDRLPHPGFTAETLKAREDLLRSSADLLSDGERRAAYESDLTSLARHEEEVVPALDIPSSKELAGLLLLFEAGQPLECFELTARLLQPPQAPALGSGREADLALLAALSAREAAAELRQQRHYEAAAGILQQGLQMLQRMGQYPDQRELIHRDLELLTPYRVLDLLSRDLGATQERREGLALLEQLVQRRGGLEGDADPNFGLSEFQAFFKQIRSYLTVQEQVDLFSRWADAGSVAADFLATTALTASGFAQRKPERIAAARDRLLASRREGVEPLLANLHLLLGEVDLAKARFAAGADAALKAWAERQGDDPLGQLCAYCRDWLLRDVLPGYRDLEADPDLEAYFSDRDVVAYVEQEDRRRGTRIGSGATYAGGATATAGFSSGFTTSADFGALGSSPLPPSSLGSGGFAGVSGGLGDSPASRFAPPPEPEGPEEDEVPLTWSLPRWRLPPFLRRPGPLIAAIAGVVLLTVAASWLLRQRRQPAATSAPPASRSAAPEPAKPARRPAAAALPPPLTAAAPDATQIRSLLEAWLNSKSAVLAGGPVPAGLDRLARPRPIARLLEERERDRSRGERQKIEVQVKEVTITERSPIRIAAAVDLAYSDVRVGRQGEPVDRTPATTLRNTYVFGRDGDTWRFAASAPAD
jgi:hypothetical protein